MSRLFSGRVTTGLIFLLSVGARLVQVIYYYNPRVDASFQLIAAKNLITGKGVSIDTVSASDLAHVLYTPLINWPPGYSFLVAPFMVMIGNYMIAAIVLDAVMAVVMLVVSNKILKTLDVPLYLRNIGLLLMGFYIYFFYLIASSDAVAIPFFLIALFIFLKMVKAGTCKPLNVFLLIACLVIFASVKYLFMPVALILPVMLMIRGWQLKSNKFLRSGLASFIFVAIGIALILIYQKLISGSATYISQPERSFFPEHLLEAYPFIPASFLKPETVAEILPGNIEFTRWFYLVFHLVVFLTASIFVITRVQAEYRRPFNFRLGFYIITWAVSVCLVLLLAILSIRVAKEEILPGWFWTYIEEARYYGLAIVLIQLSVLLYVSLALVNNKKRNVTFSLILLAFFLPEIARGIYFTTNRVRKMNSEEYSWQYENRFQKYADSVLVKNRVTGQPVVVTGSSYYMNHRVSLYSKVPLLDNAKVINDLSSLQTSRSVLLLVILQKKEFPSFKEFIAASKLKEAGVFEDYHFYTVHVNSH